MDPSIPQFELDETDLKIEWYSGSGAGGQHRNKHQNSCRLTHIPSGMVVTSQCRSRKNSYDEALDTIKKRLDAQFNSHYTNIISDDRRQKVGSGQRGDKIRTYRFQDDRVQDHNTGTVSYTHLRAHET